MAKEVGMTRLMQFAVLAALALGGARLAAQDAARAESFMGGVKAVSDSSITVERGAISRIFTVNPKTHVSAKGSSAKTRENRAAGKPGLTVPDAVHVGDQVLIKYLEQSGTLVATEIQVRATIAKK
jgi:hypothetical protein